VHLGNGDGRLVIEVAHGQGTLSHGIPFGSGNIGFSLGPAKAYSSYPVFSSEN
jgi:hypothetical protein